MIIFVEHLGKTEVDILVLEILRVPIEIGLGSYLWFPHMFSQFKIF